MTPRALMDTVLARFPVMFIQEPALSAYLTQALGTYQDHAGPFVRVVIPEGVTMNLPAMFLEVATCMDAKGRWHEVTVTPATETVPAYLTVIETAKSARPYSLWYFLNLRGMNHRTDELPVNAVGLLTEYLEALLAVPNNQRQRQVMQATGVPVELPGDEELRQRLDLLVQEMEETAAMIPMASVVY